MLGIVLPAVVAGSVAASIGNVVLPVRVVNERIIIIYVYIVVASPAAVAAPSAAPSGAHHHPHTKRNRHPGSVVARRRISDGWVGVRRRSVDNCGFVARNVHDIGLCLLNYDDLLVLHNLSFDLHLIVGF